MIKAYLLIFAVVVFCVAIRILEAWIDKWEVRRIKNCFGQIYLTRVILWRFKSGEKMMLNYFHRSDEDRFLHDHPWAFKSFVLWRGYLECTPTKTISVRQFQLIQRPATWKHRVILRRTPDGREKAALTLVFTGPKIRAWGYNTPEGWISHDDWWKKEGCL